VQKIRHLRGQELVSISLALLGFSQLVYGLLPIQSYSSSEFGRLAIYQSLIIGFGIVISSPTYSLMLAERFNDDLIRSPEIAVKSWLGTFYLLLSLLALFFIIFGEESTILYSIVLIVLLFFSNFESASLRAKLSHEENWASISIMFASEAILRLSLAIYHFMAGTPSVDVLILESLVIQSLVVAVAMFKNGNESWKLVSIADLNHLKRYLLVVLTTISAVTLNSFSPALSHKLEMLTSDQVTVSVYLLMISRIPVTLVFPLIQPALQKAGLRGIPRQDFLKYLPRIALILVTFQLVAFKGLEKLSNYNSDFGLVLESKYILLCFLVSLLFVLESAISFSVTTFGKIQDLAKSYLFGIFTLALVMLTLANTLGLFVGIILAEVVFVLSSVFQRIRANSR
jgi:hypothetical protein